MKWPNLQILFKIQVNQMKIDNFRNLAYVDFLAYVDLLANVDLKNTLVVEFSDLKYKSSLNFKSIGWKLRILEIPSKLLTFGLCCPLAYVDLLANVDLKNNWWLN